MLYGNKTFPYPADLNPNSKRFDILLNNTVKAFEYQIYLFNGNKNPPKQAYY
ncbi:MAG: hypothetical protein ACJAX3_001620 [Patiriisocius sp.]|jgi:hypothetical protein